MLRFLGKTTASTARIGGSSHAEVFAAVDEGLSAWELVNVAASDDEDLYFYDSDGVISGGDDVTDDEPESNPDVDVVISVQALSVSPPTAFPVEVTFNYALRDVLRDVDAAAADDDDDHHHEDDDDNQYDYDVDDEMVPWKLKDRFGKQRMTKMGKKGGPKLKKGKQLPYYINRPGCPYEKFRGH